jgi:hypothetical protein
MTRLLTDAQVCEQFGIPSKWTLRTMRGNGLIAGTAGRGKRIRTSGPASRRMLLSQKWRFCKGYGDYE